MPRYEYKVVAAPKKGQKARGVRSTEDRFALALQTVMNDQGIDGWEYQRTDTLPCEERSGLTGKSTAFQNLMVFRREIEQPKAKVAEETTFVTPAAIAPPAPARTETPTIETVIRDVHSQAPALGAATSSNPGKTADAPDVASS